MSVPALSLRALLEQLVDYAGMFPPAGLPLYHVAASYESYARLPESWILNRLILPATHLQAVRPEWRVSLIAEKDPGRVPKAVETLETKLPRGFSLPTYCEVPLASVPKGAFVKIRAGGLRPDAIPSTEWLADFLMQAAARRVPFKATAGLHHPIRSGHSLTYAPDSPRAVVHGFLNLFLAAAFAWHGATRADILAILNETDRHAFTFDDSEAHCRDLSIATPQIAEARRDFAHSFGSCSFEEPIADLRQLELLP